MSDLPGYISDTELYYEDSSSSTPLEPINPSESTPCCNSAAEPGGTNVGDSPGEDTTQAYSPWTRNCEGEGLVPFQSTPSDPESWAA